MLACLIGMTPHCSAGDDPEDIRILVRAISVAPAATEDPEVRKAAQHLFGRADVLELAHEVLLEEQLLRRLRAAMTGDSGRGSGPYTSERPRALPTLSLVSRAADSRGSRSWRRVGLAAAAAILVGVALNWNATSRLLETIRADGAVESRTVATRAAELDTVNLPDGSRAVLAPNSNLRYSMSALAGPRELRLEGEALFDVKHDDDRPFHVRTRRAVVEDLGTTFVVREYAEDSRARVAVRSGAASLHASDGLSATPINLRPGDGAYVDSSGNIARFTGDPASFGAWTAGYLTFDGAPLPEVLSQLEAWFDVEFRMTDSMLKKQHFTGGLSSTSLPKALAILGPIVHARFAQEGRVVAVTARPGGR